MDYSSRIAAVHSFYLDMLRGNTRTPSFAWSTYEFPSNERRPLHDKSRAVGIYSWYAFYSIGVLNKLEMTAKPFKESHSLLAKELYNLPQTAIEKLIKDLENTIPDYKKDIINRSYNRARLRVVKAWHVPNEPSSELTEASATTLVV